jgi:UDP-N-acetylmuramoyl-tripeptide--D-alanyl-D-alanine ligase
MQALTLEEVSAAIGGRILGQIVIPTVTSVSTDSRQVAGGALFFAIVGERFDGHRFVEEVLDGGASAAVVSDLSRIASRYHDSGRLILVSDTVAALGRLGGWYRQRFAASVIAVAGSNGKTTTKELIYGVLSSKMRGRAAPASFNNSIGVPLTLLSVDPADEFVVVEIGTNHPGEVASLGRMARPDMVVITSIGQEHLEFFGDLKSVAREEFSLLATTSVGKRAFVAMSEQAAGFAPARAIEDCTTATYGLGDGADLRAENVRVDRSGQRFRVNGRFEYRLATLGTHNVVNALGAVAIGARFRLAHDEMAAALRGLRLPPMRMERTRIGQITLINDAYNANPDSMVAAFAAMDELPTAGRKVLVLGDMLELGDSAVRCHQAVGREAGRSGAQVIIAAGSYARVVADGATGTAGLTKRIYSFPTVEILGEKIGSLLEPGDVVLLKASRAIGLERLMDQMKEWARSRPVGGTRRKRRIAAGRRRGSR